MRLITHNILVSLNDTDAASCVQTCLDYDPDIIGLVEVGRGRRNVLAKFGTVIAAPKLRRLFRKAPTDGIVWVYPLGGQPIGVRADKFEVLTVRRLVIAPAAEGVRQTDATEVTLRPRAGGRTIAILNTHPVAHHSRRRNLIAWRRAMVSIDNWADAWSGFPRYVMGDLNKEHVTIDGLVSCRKGNGDLPTFRGRPIDHIFGPRPFADAVTVATKSDHRALVADEREQIRRPKEN